MSDFKKVLESYKAAVEDAVRAKYAILLLPDVDTAHLFRAQSRVASAEINLTAIYKRGKGNAE